MAATAGHHGDAEEMARIVTEHMDRMNQGIAGAVAEAGGGTPGNGGGTNVNITVNATGDASELARAVADEVNAVLGEKAMADENTRSS